VYRETLSRMSTGEGCEVVPPVVPPERGPVYTDRRDILPSCTGPASAVACISPSNDDDDDDDDDDDIADVLFTDSLSKKAFRRVSPAEKNVMDSNWLMMIEKSLRMWLKAP
jgi:hypothetical protein